MDALKFAVMLNDKHILDLKRMEYKYSSSAVAEMLELLYRTGAEELPLQDFSGNPLLFRPGAAQISVRAIKRLMKNPGSTTPFGLQSMGEEIHASLKIENIHSDCKSIRRILNGFAPQDESEARIYGMKRGLDFIADKDNRINEENLYHLYQIAIGDYLPEEDRLLPNHWYRHDTVYVVGSKVEHQGLAADRVPQAMQQLIAFANREDEMDDLQKAAVMHFYMAYIHPYFDGNGRIARLLHQWYLVQREYPCALFVSLSEQIQNSRGAYYRAYDLVEQNALVSGRIDVTPYLAYFANEVYARLAPEEKKQESNLQKYQQLLQEGKITAKEKELWEYVLSAYGGEEFTTKQLEKAHGNVAYATVRGFVLKFSEAGLLKAQKYGGRTKYRVG